MLQSSATLTAARLNICLSLGTFHMTSLHQAVEQRNIVLLRGLPHIGLRLLEDWRGGCERVLVVYRGPFACHRGLRLPEQSKVNLQA